MLRVMFEDSMSKILDKDEVKESFQESFKTEVNYNILLRGKNEKTKRERRKKSKP